MATFFNDLTAQIKGIWARLEGHQRLVVVAVVFAAVVGLGGIVWFAGQPSYEVVFVATTQDQITRAKQALNQAGVSFKPDGDSFQVERSQAGLARQALNGAGLGGLEAPLLSGGSLIEDGATKAFRLDEAKRVMAERAILKLKEVVGVNVSASRPNRMVAFRDTQRSQQARATVLIDVAMGAPFESTAHAAASIASAQLGVPMENIEVVSAAGSRRWRYNPDRAAGAGSSEFLTMQRGISQEKTDLAQQRLDQMWPGKTSVQVTVELDPSWEVRSEKVLPDEPIMISEETSKDSTDGAAVAADAAASKSKNEQKTRKYVTEIGERRTGKMAPEIRRMSVAVLYDRSLTEQEGFVEADLEKAVKAIVGWDPDRDSDESFSTLTGTFAPPPEIEVASGGPGIGEMITRWGPTVGQVLGVIVVVMFLRGLFKRSRVRAPEPEPEPEIPEEDLAPEEQQKRMRREIERSIANDPAALAKMLEAWLMESKA